VYILIETAYLVSVFKNVYIFLNTSVLEDALDDVLSGDPMEIVAL
jgi:hypothetical protein